MWTAEDGIVAGGGQTRGREDEGPHQEEGLIEEDLDREVIRGEIGTEEGTGVEVDLEDEMVTAGTETEAEAVLEEEIGGPDRPEVIPGGGGLGLGLDLDLPEEGEGVVRRRMVGVTPTTSSRSCCSSPKVRGARVAPSWDSPGQPEAGQILLEEPRTPTWSASPRRGPRDRGQTREVPTDYLRARAGGSGPGRGPRRGHPPAPGRRKARRRGEIGEDGEEEEEEEETLQMRIMQTKCRWDEEGIKGQGRDQGQGLGVMSGGKGGGQDPRRKVLSRTNCCGCAACPSPAMITPKQDRDKDPHHAAGEQCPDPAVQREDIPGAETGQGLKRESSAPDPGHL